MNEPLKYHPYEARRVEVYKGYALDATYDPCMNEPVQACFFLFVRPVYETETSFIIRATISGCHPESKTRAIEKGLEEAAVRQAHLMIDDEDVVQEDKILQQDKLLERYRKEQEEKEE